MYIYPQRLRIFDSGGSKLGGPALNPRLCPVTTKNKLNQKSSFSPSAPWWWPHQEDLPPLGRGLRRETVSGLPDFLRGIQERPAIEPWRFCLQNQKVLNFPACSPDWRNLLFSAKAAALKEKRRAAIRDGDRNESAQSDR